MSDSSALTPTVHVESFDNKMVLNLFVSLTLHYFFLSSSHLPIDGAITITKPCFPYLWHCMIGPCNRSIARFLYQNRRAGIYMHFAFCSGYFSHFPCMHSLHKNRGSFSVTYGSLINQTQTEEKKG